MENYRKLIKFGNSSFVVSLPNKWVKMNKLEKGATVNLHENGNNELILSLQGQVAEEKLKEITLDLKGKDEKEIQREIVSSYIYGYDVINVKGFTDNLRTVRNVIYSLIGLEIVEQDKNVLVVKSLLSLEDISIEKYVRRIDMVIRSMMEETLSRHKENMYSHLKDRDRDVNRLTYLLLRVIKCCIDNPRLAQSKNYPLIELFRTWSLLSNLEGIGDECKRISRLYSKTKGKHAMQREFEIIFKNLHHFYIDMITAYYKQDKTQAYNLASQNNNLFNFYETLLEKSSSIYEVSLIEKFKNMASNIKGISRLTYQW